MDNLHFLFGAYTAVWVMLFLYLWFMGKRTRRLEEQLEELLRVLRERGERSRGSQMWPEDALGSRGHQDTPKPGDPQCR